MQWPQIFTFSCWPLATGHWPLRTIPMVEIAPSILSADFARLGEEIQAAQRGGAGLIHVDIMDGQFVPDITIGPLVLKAGRQSTRLPLDCHLMISDPHPYLRDFARAGAAPLAARVPA